MRNRSKALLSLLLALALVLGVSGMAFAETAGEPVFKEAAAEEDLTGKTVILHSNDVHGAVDGYAKIAALRSAYEAKGAKVFVVDAGDFSQGDPYVNINQGYNAVTLMNAAGYDYATLGNHEFDFGAEQMEKNLEDAEFTVLCANYLRDGAPVFESNAILEGAEGLKIGLFGLDTPESLTKANPAKMVGLSFPAGAELADCAQTQIDALRSEGAEVVIGLTHLGIDAESAVDGNRSVDVYAAVTGLDLFLDAHTHAVMTEGEGGEPIQSTGTKFANIGVVVLGAEGIEDRYLVSCEGLESDPDVQAVTEALKAEVDALYDEVIATSEVVFEGTKDANRSKESTNGNLITDAMYWYIENHQELLGGEPLERVVVIQHGGGIRAEIPQGEVTAKTLLTVYPFGNTLSTVSVKGADLLEAFEASTFCTPENIGGYPQTANIRFTIDTTKEFDAGELYPNSTYHRPNSINRVTIESIGGQPFDPEATYTVVTNDFLAAGGDTWYALSIQPSLDEGTPLDQILTDYVVGELGGVLSAEKYGQTRGDANIIYAEETPAVEEAPAVEETPAVEEAPAAETPVAAGVTYVAVPGDCLWALAERFYGDGTLFGHIAAANYIPDPYVIWIGQEIIIP